jgi:hypothetical protein
VGRLDDHPRVEQALFAAGGVAACAIGLGLLAGAGWVTLRVIAKFDASKINLSPTVQQALWLTVTALGVLIVLLIIAVVLKWTKVDDSQRGALGLPEGSISAVIALLLLFLFSLLSVFVYTQTQESENFGITRLPEGRIIKIERVGAGPTATYNATLSRENSTSTEIGRTTLATVSTLLVAIVGFYFGQRAAERAATTDVVAGLWSNRPLAASARAGPAGSPGTWSPSGSRVPASVSDLRALPPTKIQAKPSKHWDKDQYVETEDGGEAYWDGKSWKAGKAPQP